MWVEPISLAFEAHQKSLSNTWYLLDLDAVVLEVSWPQL